MKLPHALDVLFLIFIESYLPTDEFHLPCSQSLSPKGNLFIIISFNFHKLINTVESVILHLLLHIITLNVDKFSYYDSVTVFNHHLTILIYVT